MKQLRKHQVEARDAILDALKKEDRTTFVSATGTGKTITLNDVAMRSANKVVIFFPSLALVNQTINEWRGQGVNGYKYVAVCSDSTVMSVSSDTQVVTDGELSRSGALVTRDPNLLRKIVETHQKVVVFATYQSADKVEASKVSFDLLICDEAHHLTGVGVFGKEVLDDSRIPAKKRIFATATPRVYSTKHGIDETEVEVRSMDDTELFGNISHSFGLREAINTGILSPYKVYIVEINEEDLKPYGIDPKDATSAETRMVMGLAAHKKMSSDLGVKRTIAYLSSKKRARDFAASAGGSYITGDMNSTTRAAILSNLVTNGGIVSNVRCLTEGVDVPALDAVEFIDPRNSKVEIVQAVGRVIRVSPGKEYGYVVLPVLAESLSDEKDTYSQVWDVLLQMAENDTLLRAQINVDGGYYSPQEKSESELGEKILEIVGGSQGTQSAIVARLTESISLKVAYMVDPEKMWLARHWEWLKSVKSMAEIIQEARLGLIKGNLPQVRADDLDREAPGWRGE